MRFLMSSRGRRQVAIQAPNFGFPNRRFALVTKQKNEGAGPSGALVT
jgi:hypothetical protein